MKNKPTMLTFPRSGKNWMDWCIRTNTDLEINFMHYVKLSEQDRSEMDGEWIKNHDLMLNAPIITIVRNPVECLSSIYAMEGLNFVQERYQQYIDHFEFILDRSELIFDFNNLKDKTDKIISHLCQEFGGNITGDNFNFLEYSKWHEETQSKAKLVTSKTSENYSLAMDLVNSQDLSEHNRLYNEAKERCIVL